VHLRGRPLAGGTHTGQRRDVLRSDDSPGGLPALAGLVGQSGAGFLPWLASWVNLVLDENWPIQKQRELIRSAVELYRWRGTKRGLREYLRIYTGVEPEIIEHFTPADGGPYTFTVIIRVDDPSAVNEALVRRVIEAEKPAHTTYNLRIEQKQEARDKRQEA